MQLIYNDHKIDQRDDNYVNLTQMAKANRKRLNNYLQSPETQKYLKAAQESNRLDSSQMTEVLQTAGFGKNKATWGHPLVALHFGQWISPEFHVWCNQNIHTLMTTGTTSIDGKQNDRIDRVEAAMFRMQQEIHELRSGQVTSLTVVKTQVEVKPKQKSLLQAALQHPNPELKEIPCRRKVSKLIVQYCGQIDRHYINVYREFYEHYKLAYGYDVYRESAKSGEKCQLTQMEKDGEIDRFHQMVTILTCSNSLQLQT